MWQVPGSALAEGDLPSDVPGPCVSVPKSPTQALGIRLGILGRGHHFIQRLSHKNSVNVSAVRMGKH